MKIQTPASKPNNATQPSDGWLLKPLDRPSYTDTLVFPDDITKLSGKDVGALLGKYTGLYAYVVSECAKVNQEVLRIDSEIFRCKNNISRTAMTYGKNKYQIDGLVRNDMKHEQLQLKRNTLLERKEVTERFMDIYDRYISALSREMTRRSSEMQRT